VAIISADNVKVDKHQSTILLNQPYKLPTGVVIVDRGSFHLVINPNSANWLVLDSVELEAYRLLSSGNIIKNVINELAVKFKKRELALSIVKRVLTQAEARHFTETTANYIASTLGLYIFLTYDCNLKCSHCFLFNRPKVGTPLQTNQWKKILFDFANNDGKHITFSGGEPTLHNSFFDILSYAHNLGLTVTVLTNGTNISQDLINTYSLYVDELQVSLDGPNKVSHEMVRGKNTFFKTLSNIKTFLHHGINVTLAMTPIMETFSIFEELFVPFSQQLLHEYPTLSIKLTQNLLPTKQMSECAIDKNDYYLRGRKLINNLYPNYSHNSFYSDHPINKLHLNCGYGEISITPDGSIYFCSRIGDLPSVGNLRSMSIGETLKLADEEKRRTSVENILPCRDCCIRYICAGGCRIDDIVNLAEEPLLVNCNTAKMHHIFDFMIDTKYMYASFDC